MPTEIKKILVKVYKSVEELQDTEIYICDKCGTVINSDGKFKYYCVNKEDFVCSHCHTGIYCRKCLTNIPLEEPSEHNDYEPRYYHICPNCVENIFKDEILLLDKYDCEIKRNKLLKTEVLKKFK